jgi:putative transposase
MKYRPEFPDRFGCLQHSRSFCGPFFGWYNTEHRHSGLAMLTPQDVHYGLAEQRLAKRAAVLAAAYAAHPERFPHGVPTPDTLPHAVWINKPVGCGCEEETELVGCPKSADLETPRARSTPESAVIRPSEEEMLLVTAH